MVTDFVQVQLFLQTSIMFEIALLQNGLDIILFPLPYIALLT